MIVSYEGVRLPALPTHKDDLRAYFLQLTFTLERELVEIPHNVAELRKDCREMQKRLIMCNVDIPQYDGRMKEYVE